MLAGNHLLQLVELRACRKTIPRCREIHELRTDPEAGGKDVRLDVDFEEGLG